MQKQSQQETQPGVVLAIVSVAAFVASLDLFIVNVAFDDIGRDFQGASLSDVSWVLNGYAIVYAALLVPLGRLADRFGRKAGFLGGLALFTLASAASAASPGLWWLVGFRALQAVGAAALTPTSLALLLTATPLERRARAVRTWAATGALASAAGPFVGGLLVELSWRWVFIVNVPIGVLGVLAAVRYVPDSRDTAGARRPDLIGALGLTVAIGALSLGLVRGPDWGWGSAPTVGSFVLAAALIVLFARRSITHPQPVVEPDLIRVRTFAWANVTALLYMVAFAAGLLSVILWMQSVWGYSALRSGLAVAPGPLMVPVFAAVSQRLSARVSAGRLAALGCTLFAIGGVIVLSSVGATPAYAADLLPGWLTMGIGVGFALPTILSSATVDLPAARAATGSAVVNMARQVGSVLGVSVFIAVLGSPHSYRATHAAFERVWWVMAAVSLLAAVTALGMTPRRVPISTTDEVVEGLSPVSGFAAG
jgi:EmrB/QacA subfamily drug resistance transporter